MTLHPFESLPATVGRITFSAGSAGAVLLAIA